LGGSVHNIKKNTEDVLVASKEIGPEVNSYKTKDMVISREQIAWRSHSTKIDSSSFERLLHFNRYLGTTLTNQNSIQEEIKSRLKSGNACYHSIQNLVFQFGFQKFKNLKMPPTPTPTHTHVRARAHTHTPTKLYLLITKIVIELIYTIFMQCMFKLSILQFLHGSYFIW